MSDSQNTRCTMLPDGTLAYTTLTRAQPKMSEEAVNAYQGVPTGGCPTCKPTQLGVPMPYQLLQGSQEPQTQVAMKQTALSLNQAVNLGLVPVWQPTFKAYPYHHAATVTNARTGFPMNLSNALGCGSSVTYY